MKTLYDLLGVRQDADVETVRTAFRKAVKAHHPDLNATDADAGERLREIIAASAILRDTEKRTAYDRRLELERQRRWFEWKRVFIQCSIAALLSAGLVGGSAFFVTLPTDATVSGRTGKDTTRGPTNMAVALLPAEDATKGQDSTGAKRKDAMAAEWRIVTRAAPPSAIMGTDRAIAHDAPAVRVAPVDAKFYSERGIAAYRRGDFDQAIADFDQAIRLDRNDAQTYRERGKVWEDKDDHDRALADYDQAIRIDPNDPKAFHDRGLLWRRKGALDSALIDLDRAIRFSFADARIYSDRGVVWYEKGHYDRALADFNQAIKIEPNFAAAYINRGMTLQRRGDFDLATADFDRAIEINPNSFIVIQWAHFEPLLPRTGVED